MHTTVDVGIIGLIIGHKRINYTLRLLGSGGVVEIHEGMPVDVLMQYRKFVPDDIYFSRT